MNELKQKTLVDVLESRAQESQTQTAYIFLKDGETQADSLTYADLMRQSRAIAAYLQTIGAAGSRALLVYPSGLEFIAAFFGCLSAGVVPVPAYPPRLNQNGDRLRAIAADSQATFALSTRAIIEKLQTQLDTEPEFAFQWITTSPEDLQSWGEDIPWKPPTLNSDGLALLQYTSGSTGIPKGVMISHSNLIHNAALIQHCFQDSPESMGVSWLPMYHDMGLIGGVLQPLFIGRPMVLMSPTAFIQKPVRWLQAISRYRATTSGGPNFAYDLCCQKIRAEQALDLDLSSWKVAFTGSESIRAKTLEDFTHQFRGCGFDPRAFTPCYGMAEATLMVASKRSDAAPTICAVDGVALEQHRLKFLEPSALLNGDLGKTSTLEPPQQEVVQNLPIQTVPTQIAPTPNLPTQNLPTQNVARWIVGCGKAWLDQKLIIVDPVSLVPCAPQSVGEIWVSSPSVAQGYWQRPDESDNAFNAYALSAQQSEAQEGPFLRTGDLGFLHQGELFITGRLKDVVIIRGRNHYPQDIEESFQTSHPGLRAGHGAAFSIPVDGIERLVIAQEIERQALRALEEDKVIQAIRQAISEKHQLQIYAIALLKPGALPKTSSGKVQRSACRAAFLAGEFTPVAEWRESAVNVQDIQRSAQAMLEKLSAKEDFGANPLLEADFPQRQKASGLTQEEIQRWIVANLALQLQVSPDEVDITEPFSHYGLDSAVAVGLTAELSDWIGKDLDPTIFWEYPSIESLAHYLVDC